MAVATGGRSQIEFRVLPKAKHARRGARPTPCEFTEAQHQQNDEQHSKRRGHVPLSQLAHQYTDRRCQWRRRWQRRSARQWRRWRRRRGGRGRRW